MVQFASYLLLIFADLGYLGVVFLMAIESSFIPFPSEIIIPPAAFLAAQGEMNIYLVILSGIIGSLIGSTINYFLALTLGRKIIYTLADKKIARLFLVSPTKLKKAEKYFLEYGKSSTFIGRLVPAVRQLISIPAGFSRMNFKYFIFFTTLGSTLWVTVLAILGYVFGANQEIFSQYYQEIWYFSISLGVIFLCWLGWKIRSKKIKDH